MPHEWKKYKKLSHDSILWECDQCGSRQVAIKKPYENLGIHFRRVSFFSIYGPNFDKDWGSLGFKSLADAYWTCEQLVAAKVQCD